MDKFIVIGGKRLQGTVRVSGAKNSVLPILAASLLSGGWSAISDVPQLRDVHYMKDLLELLGARITCEGKKVTVDGNNVRSVEVDENLMRRLRASNLVMGALLGRFGKVTVSYPGGCAIGSRPMDLHLKGFAAMGARISEKHGYVTAEAPRLRGCEIHLDFPSVGATENLITAAVLACGDTVLRNVAKEPEIVDLQNFLNILGARISGAGTDVIKIKGVKELGSGSHNVIPDRIEAGTHMVASAITGGEVVINNVIPEHLEAVTAKLREAGVEVEIEEDRVYVAARGRPKAVDARTMPYPGFPTDLQPQLMVLMSVAEGSSIISESIFENRFKHVDELRRMGSNIKIEGRVAVIKGVPKLSGAFVDASDLRAGSALVLAGLAAEDATVIENVWHVDRGYEDLEKKYNALGACIMRVNRH